MMLSVIIPAHNEEDGLRHTVLALHETLTQNGVPHEIVIVNDHSTDRTAEVLGHLEQKVSNVRWVNNDKPGGFGYAVQTGLSTFSGDAACIVMADASDDPGDLVRYYAVLTEGYECAFGSRFTSRSRVVDYPRHKLILNRLANHAIQFLFGLHYNDVTNAFKCYRRDVIEGVQPILSAHFNLTVELPLKAITRGYSYEVIPINWYNRTTGISKLKIKEMGSRYVFIVLYVLLEKLLSRGDYRRRDPESVTLYSGAPLPQAAKDPDPRLRRTIPPD
jgi:dolichol-phosphate mannosyltransferase